MAITIEDIPKIVVLFTILGGSMYVAFWVAGQIRNEIKVMIK